MFVRLLLSLLAAGGMDQQPVQLRGVKLPAGVNRKWLQADCDLIWNVRRALPPDPTRPGLTGLPPNHSLVETVDLGFGVARNEQRVGAGYLSCTITSVTHERALASMKIWCWTSVTNLEQTRPIIERALGPGFKRDDRSATSYAAYRTDYEFPDTKQRLRAALDQRLGPLLPATVPAELAPAYATLMSPEEKLAVGDTCGDGASPAEGASETKALRSARRIDLLRNVLRGPNPEARVYALEALRKLRALDAADRSIAERLAAAPLKVTTCSGCIYDKEPMDRALRMLEPLN
jgi:hypothetical protein